MRLRREGDERNYALELQMAYSVPSPQVADVFTPDPMDTALDAALDDAVLHEGDAGLLAPIKIDDAISINSDDSSSSSSSSTSPQERPRQRSRVES